MLATAAQYETTSSGGGGAAILVVLLIYIPLLAVMIATYWKIFTKMGEPGWAGLIPFYNYYCIFKRSRPEQAVLLTVALIVPCVGWVVLVVAMYDLSILFGKDPIYTLGLVLLPFIFGPILAFGSAQYVGPGSNAGASQVYGGPQSFGGNPPPPPSYGG